jgi:putative folate metabolism gamma-glutamate ligase
MIVTPYKTHKITTGENLFAILDTYLPKLTEKSIVVITSKIISICQNNIAKNDGTIDKKKLITQEADKYFIDENLTQYGTVIPTIKEDILIANAGIDESNANGDFVLWPKDIDHTTTEIWEYLRKKHGVKELGILITDSRTTPLRWGVSGVGISWCGFAALKDYRGKPDIFGRLLRMSQESIIDGLAASAVVVMGEGDEQTPLTSITDIPFVTFQNRPPTQEDRTVMRIDIHDDLYGKLLTSVEWKTNEEEK